MKTLHRFIFRSYLPPFAMTFVISVFILFMQFLWKWVDEIVGKGLKPHVIAELFFYAALSLVPLALPMSVLLSSLMTFGNLGEHYELASMKSSGLSLMRIMRPLLVFTVSLTIGAFLFANYVLPYTNLKFYSALFDVHNQKLQMRIPQGEFYNGIEGYSIFVERKSREGDSLFNIKIYDHSDHMGNVSLTTAKSGRTLMTKDNNFLVIILYDGTTYNEAWNQKNAEYDKPFSVMNFKEQVFRLDLSGFNMTRTDESLFRENYQMLNGKQLLRGIDSMKTQMVKDRNTFYEVIPSTWLFRTRKYWKVVDSLHPTTPYTGIMNYFTHNERQKIYEFALSSAHNCKQEADNKVTELDGQEHSILNFKNEFWRKFTYSLACLIMFFIGAPLGAIIRKGGLGMPTVVSILLFIAFWVLNIIGEKISKEGTIPPEIGMWIGCAIFLPVGIWLTRKATADSALFDMDSIRQGLKRIFSLFSRSKTSSATIDEVTHENFPDHPDENSTGLH